nr:uncharacterized protein LOC121501962 [Drosophila kikkawai]
MASAEKPTAEQPTAEPPTAATVSLRKFIAASDRVSIFEAKINTPGQTSPSLHLLQVRQQQVRALWDKVETEYDMCSDLIAQEGSLEMVSVLQSKYDYCYSVYESCSAEISATIDSATPQAVQPPSQPIISSGCRLPPCDTEVFDGDYLRWPTFRDLFTAVYVNNPRLTPVEKLFHLLTKTSGEAKAIVSKSPLTNDGFASAWEALQDRFQNKRLLVNSQLKLLFNLSSISKESGHALKELQSTIQGVLDSASTFPNIHGQLGLSAGVPVRKQAAEKMNTFLSERYRTLEAIEDMKPTQAVPKKLQSFETKVSTKPKGSSTPSAQLSSGPSTSNASTSNPTVQNYFASGTTAVLLSTAIIDVCHLGTNYRARALIDSGSEATFISERLFNLIKLPFRSIQTQVSGLNQSVSAKSTRLCHFQVRSPTKPGLQLDTAAYVLPALAGKLPSYPIARDSLKDLPALQWADPKFYESSQIDVLIGADILPSVMLSGTRGNICGSLLGQETIFGWVLTGPISQVNSNRVASFTTQVHQVGDEALDTLLSKFWEVEDLPVQMVKESDSYCERNFLRTTKKDASGSVIQEYLDLGHMKEVPSTHNSPTYYLPHHAVIKPESTTTKLRVVFNASSPSANGTSLNDILHAGPVLQSDLTIQILKWRCFQYVFSADITKMYRQIWVDSKHTPFQRILFRNKEGDIRDFELQTVTFGVNCAPFLAIRVLQQLAKDVQGPFPQASRIIQHHMYVDDVLAGANSVKDAQDSVQELRAALSSAGFPLRKWTSNNKSILSNIPAEHLLHSEFLDIDAESTAKTLGIRWRAKSDEFYFVPPDLIVQPSYTKREVLSQIAKLFDPAGWLAPFIIRSKMFMQEIWLQDLGWDDKLPTHMSQRWQSFLREYSDLNKIRVPRWVGYQPEVIVEHHGFCDASQKAYGAAIYVRVVMGHQILTRLLTAKTRVAPVKTVSLPRLELCGAVLLTEMVTAILPHLPTASSDLRCWTDSTIVLAWLHSRGVPLIDLADSKLWWQGPEWLQGPRELWPAKNAIDPTELEQRAVKVHFSQTPSEEYLERFSKLDKALRVLTYVLRFLKRCRKSSISPAPRPTSDEIREAERVLISIAQRRAYGQEQKHLAEKRSLPVSSPIANLFPFIDQHGLLRACGRLTAAKGLQYDERHPIILPYDCRLARLLIQFAHQITLHGGSQLIVRLIRSKYWIPKIKNLVKAVAIHLEPTSDLTTEKFLAAFARFVARHGCPQRVHSDNGKTFVGAATLLSRDFLQAVKESVTDAYSHQGLVWRFIPPGAPHMGGLWEAGVKSFKTLFYKASATRKYTFEELATLLAKIEACLNSRPLSPMSEDPSDLLALTPGHFLVGGPLLSTAEPEIKGEAKSILNRWQHLKAQHQQFSVRWKEEYLKELHKRYKWQYPTRNLQIGDMVVVKEDNLPSDEWRLGRISSVFPGADDLIRVVEIRTARGTIKRPVHKVILLPAGDQVSSVPRD